ncbi:MAG: hypothetical protein ACYDCH_15660 [Gaiellaceae bacterium]
MSVFRPSARATGPDAREWEIYAYRLKRAAPSGKRRLRRLAELVAEAARALRADEWTIEAVSWLPRQERYRWTTTGEHRGQVLAQVEGGLTRGDVPRPRNARYLGYRG